MITILSPAKIMEVTHSPSNLKSEPYFHKQAVMIINFLKQLNLKEFSDLLKIKGAIASQSFQRIKSWEYPHAASDSSAAALTYDGVAFKSLDAKSFSDEDEVFAQSHLRILSAVYGILCPYDIIQPYRLEAQTALKIGGNKNLYEFWGKLVASKIVDDLKNTKSKVVMNLASDEYSKMVLPFLPKEIKIVSMDFFDFKNGKLSKNIVEIKKARGAAARFIIKNKIEDENLMLAFDSNNYHFDNKLSARDRFVFVRA